MASAGLAVRGRLWGAWRGQGRGSGNGGCVRYMGSVHLLGTKGKWLAVRGWCVGSGGGGLRARA